MQLSNCRLSRPTSDDGLWLEAHLVFLIYRRIIADGWMQTTEAGVDFLLESESLLGLIVETREFVMIQTK